MKDLYLVSKWALIRRNELVDIPGHFEIHPDFLHELPREAFENAFREIGAMFYQMYTDMADDPEHFGMPLYRIDEYDYCSSQAREARSAPWNLCHLLFCLFACGRFKGGVFVADTAEVRKMNKAKKTNLLRRALQAPSCEGRYPALPEAVGTVARLKQRAQNVDREVRVWTKK